MSSDDVAMTAGRGLQHDAHWSMSSEEGLSEIRQSQVTQPTRRANWNPLPCGQNLAGMKGTTENIAWNSTGQSWNTPWYVQKSGVQARLELPSTPNIRLTLHAQPARHILSLTTQTARPSVDNRISRLAGMLFGNPSVALSLVAPRSGHRARILRPCLLAPSDTGAHP